MFMLSIISIALITHLSPGKHHTYTVSDIMQVRFSSLPARTTLAEHIRKLKLPKRPVYGFESMTEGDVVGVHALLTQYLESK